MADIVVSNAGGLADEINALRASLAELVYQRDHLKFVVCENIKMDYMLEIGNLEFNLFNLYCKFMRLKRKKEMIQTLINQGEEVDIDKIDFDLDEEFEEYQSMLDEKMKEIDDALDRKNCDKLSPEDSKDLKFLYRELVKMLHPDLHPNLSEDKKEIFVKVVDAYKAGDIDGLRIYYAMMSSFDDVDLPTLEEERDRLKALIKAVYDEISEIKSSYPYNMLVYLEDEEMKIKKQNEIRSQITAYEEAIKNQEQLIKTMMEGYNE